ncbi:hypothetical protein HHI36_002782 [Cryptolaemus montrouzieri]|uniref:Uncharacterized protein n=1 Tax=Cryptolaemus montrouzieri TaxID=559131 RepID=A0ABD2PBG7_9CUCU
MPQYVYRSMQNSESPRVSNLGEESDQTTMRTNSNGEQFVPYSVFHLNAQSIGTAQHKIECIVQENNCKFIAITEHWKGANQLPAYVVPAYKLVSSFCRREKKHGGAAVYCSGDVKCSAREDLTELSVPYLFE